MDENYYALLGAIIRQQIEDFKRDKLTKVQFHNFCYKSKWFEYINLDRDYIFEYGLKEKEKYINDKPKRKNKNN